MFGTMQSFFADDIAFNLVWWMNIIFFVSLGLFFALWIERWQQKNRPENLLINENRNGHIFQQDDWMKFTLATVFVFGKPTKSPLNQHNEKT